MQSGLYVIGTPIGNLSDISERALNTLKQMDLIAVEDTRVFSKIANYFNINIKTIAYHDHNEQTLITKLINFIKKGGKLGLVSDSGMPSINDPGFKLIREVRKENLFITSVPGPTALISALVLSGFPTDRFTFCGFFDDKKIYQDKNIEHTIIYYESPKRVLKTLKILNSVMPERKIAIVREITKIYEETIIGYPKDLLSLSEIKGECVIVIEPKKQTKISDEDLQKIINDLDISSTKNIAEKISEVLSIPKKEVYAKIIKKGNE